MALPMVFGIQVEASQIQRHTARNTGCTADGSVFLGNDNTTAKIQLCGTPAELRAFAQHVLDGADEIERTTSWSCDVCLASVPGSVARGKRTVRINDACPDCADVEVAQRDIRQPVTAAERFAEDALDRHQAVAS